ncbi:MAG TPA: tRNA guanosine(34) transglycosylase Tgt [Bacteroidales bacterium]|nr:tRNA guanosine(34) transglycosylase Tgt [Bacteroidales bacterium]
MKFSIRTYDVSTKARCGMLETSHGSIETPVFMPVGTAGTVKGVHARELRDDIHAQIILGNTYHLYLRPGIDIIHESGGLHKFSGWQHPILTDSGGYQVFSLAANRKLTAEGAIFKSHIDGSKHIFTPENVVDIQRKIGADIIMAFDECTPFPCDYEAARKSMLLTHQWLERGWKHFCNTESLYGYEQSFFPIIQGSVYHDLRQLSAETISDYDANGYAIGGLSVGEPNEVMYEMIEKVNKVLPLEKPRYLMGVGTPANILEAVALGVDMFDCVMPTRNGRNGMLFTTKGTINIKNQKWKNDFSCIDEEGEVFADTEYSKAYLHHLIISNEILGAQIASIHNLGFYMKLMKTIRQKIQSGDFSAWKNQVVKSIMKRL